MNSRWWPPGDQVCPVSYIRTLYERILIVRFTSVYGIRPDIYAEGTHLMVSACATGAALLPTYVTQIPWFETPIVFDIRAKPRNIASLTGTKGTQY